MTALSVRTMRLLGAALALSSVLAVAQGAQARDSLSIGITQFPTTLHPSIDSMMAKTYILAMTRRPLTAYDKDWWSACCASTCRLSKMAERSR